MNINSDVFCFYFDKKNKMNQSACSSCFIGNHCQIELSQNLWYFGMVPNTLAENNIPINEIIVWVFGIFLVFNGILCLQTYLCGKIRQTNLGIYLIMLSIVSIFIGILHFLWHSIFLWIKDEKLLGFAAAYHCPYAKYIYNPLVFMYNWFITGAAAERVLVECFRNYGLHDSRRRSVIFSITILLICPLSTLPGYFTIQDNDIPSPLFKLYYCQNFTELGYYLFQIITRFHLFSYFFLYILMNIIVLSKLIRRRQRFIDNDSLIKQIYLIMNRHKDFFIPYLIQTLGQFPNLVLDYVMTCQTAGTKFIANLHLIFVILQVLPFTITFYLYIYLSPVYLAIFWVSSPIGKSLRKIKKKFEFIRTNRTSYNSIPLQ